MALAHCALRLNREVTQDLVRGPPNTPRGEPVIARKMWPTMAGRRSDERRC